MLTPIPAVGWELHIRHVETDYEKLENYSQFLLDTAAAQLDVAFEQDDFGRTKYPHWTDIKQEVALLKGLLHLPSFSQVGP
jgi:hypothetical protein